MRGNESEFECEPGLLLTTALAVHAALRRLDSDSCPLAQLAGGPVRALLPDVFFEHIARDRQNPKNFSRLEEKSQRDTTRRYSRGRCARGT